MNFFGKTVNVLLIMKPLSKLVGKLESDSCLLSEVYIGFVNLMKMWGEDSVLKTLVLC